MVERKPSKFEVTGSSPVFCARVNGVLIYGVISVVAARESPKLKASVRFGYDLFIYPRSLMDRQSSSKA